MYPRSTRFDNFIDQPHVIVTVAELIDWRGNLILTLTPTGGQLSVDDSDRHRVCDLEIVDETGDLIPQKAYDLLNREDTRIRIRQGIEYPDGTQELITIGTFIIWDNIITDAGPSVKIDMQLQDLSALCSLNKVPLAMDFGSDPVTNAMALITQTTPDIVVDFRAKPALQDLVLTNVEIGDDPWSVATDWVTSAGCEMYFDPFGTLIIQTVPTYEDYPVSWRFQDDSNSSIFSLQKRMNRQTSYNQVIVIGNGADNVDGTVFGRATDFEAAFPISNTTRARALVIKDSHITSTTAAQNLADARMRDSSGMAEFINIQCAPHPCFEIGDVIYIRRAKSLVDALYIIDKISLPLVHARSMNISSRRRRIQ
jgi:hypothetical protein